jgi:hypothetical protein
MCFTLLIRGSFRAGGAISKRAESTSLHLAVLPLREAGFRLSRPRTAPLMEMLCDTSPARNEQIVYRK